MKRHRQLIPTDTTLAELTIHHPTDATLRPRRCRCSRGDASAQGAGISVRGSPRNPLRWVNPRLSCTGRSCEEIHARVGSLTSRLIPRDEPT